MAKDEYEMEDNSSEEMDESCDAGGADSCPSGKSKARKIKFRKDFATKGKKGKKVKPDSSIPEDKKPQGEYQNVRNLSNSYQMNPDGAYGGGSGNVPKKETRKLWAKRVGK